MFVEFIENGRTYMEEKEGALGFATRAVHVGNDVDKDSGAIKRPITMANSYALPYDPTDMNWSSAGANLYTRNGGTNQKYLQERVASLEGGEDCVVLASGVAALSGLFFALLNQGDHVRPSPTTHFYFFTVYLTGGTSIIGTGFLFLKVFPRFAGSCNLTVFV